MEHSQTFEIGDRLQEPFLCNQLEYRISKNDAVTLFDNNSFFYQCVVHSSDIVGQFIIEIQVFGFQGFDSFREVGICGEDSVIRSNGIPIGT